MINKTWDNFLNSEFNQDYFKQLSHFLVEQYNTKNIFPPKLEVFSAFINTDLDKVKVVILGQDPYHEKGQGCGLAFAVKPGVKVPPSLVNIYKEIERDLHVKMDFSNGFVMKWVKQGVLLLNTVLTVEEGKANSHKGMGWEIFTDHVIELLNKQNQPIVFLLWGSNAASKKKLLNNPNHLVLTSSHPSPLSVYRGFDGCSHFSKCNRFLVEHNSSAIDWRI